MSVAAEPMAPGFLAEVGLDTAEARARGCSQPVRLRGSTMLVDTNTGEATTVYSSNRELDGYTYARCGNRRASLCPSCSHEYKGDAWHLLVCGLAGGRGIPKAVADRPCTFVTLTAPSFGHVHGVRTKGPCRARRDKPVCPHGRPVWCNERHRPPDARLGAPLCVECYDYVGHVLWQWYAPELWRRFTIALQRSSRNCAASPSLASGSGVASRTRRSSSSRRAASRTSISRSGSTVQKDRTARRAACRSRRKSSSLPSSARPRRPGSIPTRCRTARPTASAGVARSTAARSQGAQTETGRSAAVVHPEQVAAYLAKYLTKATEDFGLPARVTSATQAKAVGASPHAVRIIETAVWIARLGEPYARLRDNLATLGYRGHPITKSRAYSITFGQIRRSRRAYKRDPGLDPNADIRQVLDDDSDVPDGFELVSRWVFAGQGYLSLDQAAAAVLSAAQSRTR